MNRFSVLISIGIIIFLTSCVDAAKKSPQVLAVETYQQAFAEKDADKISLFTCPEWEIQALMEMDSFQAVETRLEGLACVEAGEDGDIKLVKCVGKILTTYGDEEREFDLSLREYQVVEEKGEWLVCGTR